MKRILAQLVHPKAVNTGARQAQPAGHKGQTARRTLPPAARLIAAATLLMALVVVLTLADQTHARSVETLVSNIGQDDRSGNSLTSLSATRAQQFETGDNSGGYTLSGIVVNIKDARSGTDFFALYTDNGSDEPDTKVVDLNGNSSVAGEQSFTPATATTLSADTKYFVYFHEFRNRKYAKHRFGQHRLWCCHRLGHRRRYNLYPR